MELLGSPCALKVYESHWLDFYLAQGCNVFLFNYSGFGRSTGSPTPAALGGACKICCSTTCAFVRTAATLPH
eukprot:5866575-Amphidinium_carterae.1